MYTYIISNLTCIIQTVQIRNVEQFFCEISKTHARSPKLRKVTENKPGQTDSPVAMYLETQQTSSTRKRAELIGSESLKPNLQVEYKNIFIQLIIIFIELVLISHHSFIMKISSFLQSLHCDCVLVFYVIVFSPFRPILIFIRVRVLVIMKTVSYYFQTFQLFR